MKIASVFKWLLFVVIAVAAIIIAVLAIKSADGNKDDAESKAYTEKLIPGLFSDLTTDNYLHYVPKDLAAKTNRASMDKLFATLSEQWGKYRSYENLDGDSIAYND